MGNFNDKIIADDPIIADLFSDFTQADAFIENAIIAKDRALNAYTDLNSKLGGTAGTDAADLAALQPLFDKWELHFKTV